MTACAGCWFSRQAEALAVLPCPLTCWLVLFWFCVAFCLVTCSSVLLALLRLGLCLTGTVPVPVLVCSVVFDFLLPCSLLCSVVTGTACALLMLVWCVVKPVAVLCCSVACLPWSVLLNLCWYCTGSVRLVKPCCCCALPDFEMTGTNLQIFIY